MYMLRLFEEGDLVHPIDARLLRDGTLQIGRDPAADWTIPDPDREISRAHCVVAADARGLSVRCVGTNGVYDDASGERLPDEIEIAMALPTTLRIGRFRLVAAPAPHGSLGAGQENRTMLMTPPLGESTIVPANWEDAPAAPALYRDGSLLDAFCEGAGLDASLLSGEEPAEIMRRAGAVYRQLVLGIGDLMNERDRARAQYQLVKTTISGSGNNPFKWAPTQRLAIDLLLAGSNGFLSGPAALRASFQDIKRHAGATFAGFQASLRTAVATFDPAAVEAAGASRASLLRSRAAVQWQEVENRHADLAQQLDSGMGGSLDRAFVAGYDEADRNTLGHA